MNSSQYLSDLQDTIEPVRQTIIHHPVFEAIKTITHVQIFMQHHIAAVWDFMTLLKSLQIQLTGVTLPWEPVGSPSVRRMINDIVLGEESDLDMNGHPTSHYELYVAAMAQCGASIPREEWPVAAIQFTDHTIAVATTGPLSDVAAVFAFGREDLIPDMFRTILATLLVQHPAQLEIFDFYIRRHIEVDDGHHGPIARHMVESLCGDDSARWASATQAVLAALNARIRLWDAVYNAILAADARDNG
ncbi:DUF3050 domain-containing protein [bacterium]|nr:DUF3050 domain-containing protein [bacterium]